MKMKIRRSVEEYSTFKIFLTSLDNQLYITASVTQFDADAARTIGEIYQKIAEHLTAYSGQLVLERCFGDIDFRPTLLAIRDDAFRRAQIDTTTSVTYIEGASCFGNKFSGVQIRALKTTAEIQIRTITSDGISKGRVWKADGSTFIFLHEFMEKLLTTAAIATERRNPK